MFFNTTALVMNVVVVSSKSHWVNMSTSLGCHLMAPLNAKLVFLLRQPSEVEPSYSERGNSKVLFGLRIISPIYANAN